MGPFSSAGGLGSESDEPIETDSDCLFAAPVTDVIYEARCIQTVSDHLREIHRVQQGPPLNIHFFAGDCQPWTTEKVMNGQSLCSPRGNTDRYGGPEFLGRMSKIPRSSPSNFPNPLGKPSETSRERRGESPINQNLGPTPTGSHPLANRKNTALGGIPWQPFQGKERQTCHGPMVSWTRSRDSKRSEAPARSCSQPGNPASPRAPETNRRDPGPRSIGDPSRAGNRSW